MVVHVLVAAALTSAGPVPPTGPAELSSSRELDRLRDQLREIILRQREVSLMLRVPCPPRNLHLFNPSIAEVPAVTLAKGETVSVKHAIDWKVYDKDEFDIAIAVEDGSDLTVTPTKRTVSVENENSVEYAVTAGHIAGTFTVVVTPAVGPAVRVRVTVK